MLGRGSMTFRDVRSRESSNNGGRGREARSQRVDFPHQIRLTGLNTAKEAIAVATFAA